MTTHELIPTTTHLFARVTVIEAGTATAVENIVNARLDLLSEFAQSTATVQLIVTPTASGNLYTALICYQEYE